MYAPYPSTYFSTTLLLHHWTFNTDHFLSNRNHRKLVNQYLRKSCPPELQRPSAEQNMLNLTDSYGLKREIPINLLNFRLLGA